MTTTREMQLMRERNPLTLLNHFIDTNAQALGAQLRDHGFKAEADSPRILQGEHVTVSVNATGYRITFASPGEQYGMGIVDLPAVGTYGTVETVVLGIERLLREAASVGR